MTLKWLWHAWTPQWNRYGNHTPYSQPQALLSMHLKTNLWNLNDVGLFKSPPIYSWKPWPSEVWNLYRKCKSHSHFLLGVHGAHAEKCLRKSNAHLNRLTLPKSKLLYREENHTRFSFLIIFFTVRLPGAFIQPKKIQPTPILSTHPSRV